ncbi:MAG: NifU family protein [Bacteroidia bacterium]|jgi:Fe-S cluster biogenesis protein NfuA
MSTRNHQVYAELTPNPNSVKFVADRLLLFEGTVEYKSKAEAIDCPIAYQLFDFTGIKSVFITANFITITKEADIDWYEITNILREFIKGFLNSGEKLFLKNPVQETEAVKEPVTSAILTPQEKHPMQNNAESAIIEDKIKNMLDEFVRPAVEGDGGAIDFKSFKDGVVTVVLKGSCSGCPSSTLTLKAGIENLLKRMIPEVSEVMAEAE